MLASAEQAVHESPGTTFTLVDLLKRPVPRFKIHSPVADAVQHGGRATIQIAIEATPDPVKTIRVQVDGRQVEEQTPAIGRHRRSRGPGRRTTLSAPGEPV
jgi:hypothetical protein